MNFYFSYRLFLFLAIVSFHLSKAQDSVLTGRVTDKKTGEPLGAVSILVFAGGHFFGTVSNEEGGFRVVVTSKTDSLKFSCIGYHSVSIDLARMRPPGDHLKIAMEVYAEELKEVIVRPEGATEIIKKAILASRAMTPADNFENDFFYREIIKDKENYFSVAEAVFLGQFIPAKKEYKLKLKKGRSKEDVSYTRLFEDFHPGGGPQALFKDKFVTGFPEFLTQKKTGLFNYHKDSIIRQDEKRIYVISFDQKPDVHEALDKGRIYIDAEDYSVIKYETENSPLGIRYVKNLAGTDKIFAELLHIDFKRKGWVKKTEFVKRDGKLYLLYAYAEYKIEYKQPKKELDIDLVITTEMASTGQASPIRSLVSKDEEWKQKNISANLPTDFDSDFWGNAAVISPTVKISHIIEEIGKNNGDHPVSGLDSGWRYFQKDLFAAYQNNDSITMIPLMKHSWEDDETAGMLYKSVAGDFLIETELNISKRSDQREIPDNGFQQAGIIIRAGGERSENNMVLCVGTAGNKNIKYFLRKTENGNSKGPMNSIDGLHQWLRLEKKDNVFSAFIKGDDDQNWKRITDYSLSWGDGPLEVGLVVMARFAGSGPKMKPDMKAVFTNIKIEKIK